MSETEGPVNTSYKKQGGAQDTKKGSSGTEGIKSQVLKNPRAGMISGGRGERSRSRREQEQRQGHRCGGVTNIPALGVLACESGDGWGRRPLWGCRMGQGSGLRGWCDRYSTGTQCGRKQRLGKAGDGKGTLRGLEEVRLWSEVEVRRRFWLSSVQERRGARLA